MSVTMPPFSDYRDIGRMLHDTRESMGLTLEDIAAQLKVRLRYLQSLEKGEMGDIPGDVYARGYLRMYADYLGYDGQQILGNVEAQPAIQKTHYLPQESKQQRRTTLVVMFGCLLALLTFVVWQMNQKSETPELNLVDAVPASISEETASAAPVAGDAPVFPELCQTTGERLLPETVCRGDALLTPARPEEEAALGTIMDLKEPDALWQGRL